jgi:hypothetical protein
LPADERGKNRIDTTSLTHYPNGLLGYPSDTSMTIVKRRGDVPLRGIVELEEGMIGDEG